MIFKINTKLYDFISDPMSGDFLVKYIMILNDWNEIYTALMSALYLLYLLILGGRHSARC